MNKTNYLHVLRSALVARHCELAIERLVRGGNIRGPVHSSLGHEWIAALGVRALSDSDWIYPYYRCHAWILARLGKASRFLDWLRNADQRGEAMYLGDSARHIACANAYVAQHVPIAAGHAWIQSQHDSSSLVLASLGDGALSSGLVLESLSIARRNRAPLLLCVEDNGVQNYGVTNRAEAVTSEALASSARVPFLRLGLGDNEPADLDSLAQFVQQVRETQLPGVVHFDTTIEHPHSFGPHNQFVSATGKLIQPDAVAGQSMNGLTVALGLSSDVLRDLTSEAGHEVELAVQQVFGCDLSWRDAWYP